MHVIVRPVRPVRPVGFHSLATVSRKEGIIHLLLPYRRQRAMTRAKDRVVRQGENVFAIGLKRIRIRNAASTHRARKHGVADYGDAIWQPGYDVSDPAAGMAFGLT